MADQNPGVLEAIEDELTQQMGMVQPVLVDMVASIASNCKSTKEFARLMKG